MQGEHSCEANLSVPVQFVRVGAIDGLFLCFVYVDDVVFLLLPCLIELLAPDAEVEIHIGVYPLVFYEWVGVGNAHIALGTGESKDHPFVDY